MRHRRIVLVEPNKDALAQADVEAPLGIAQHINLILIRCIHGRAENGCGEFGRATCREEGEYEADERCRPVKEKNPLPPFAFFRRISSRRASPKLNKPLVQSSDPGWLELVRLLFGSLCWLSRTKTLSLRPM